MFLSVFKLLGHRPKLCDALIGNNNSDGATTRWGSSTASSTLFPSLLPSTPPFRRYRFTFFVSFRSFGSRFASRTLKRRSYSDTLDRKLKKARNVYLCIDDSNLVARVMYRQALKIIIYFLSFSIGDLHSFSNDPPLTDSIIIKGNRRRYAHTHARVHTIGPSCARHWFRGRSRMDGCEQDSQRGMARGTGENK